MHPIVGTSCLHKFIVGSLLRNPIFREYDNPVSMHDRRQPVRNDYCRSVRSDPVQRLLNCPLTFTVQGAGGFIKYQYRWIF